MAAYLIEQFSSLEDPRIERNKDHALIDIIVLTVVFFGERSLRRALREYEIHYPRERNQLSVDNQLLEPTNVVAFSTAPVQRRERLVGMLSY